MRKIILPIYIIGILMFCGFVYGEDSEDPTDYLVWDDGETQYDGDTNTSDGDALTTGGWELKSGSDIGDYRDSGVGVTPNGTYLLYIPSSGKAQYKGLIDEGVISGNITQDLWWYDDAGAHKSNGMCGFMIVEDDNDVTSAVPVVLNNDASTKYRNTACGATKVISARATSTWHHFQCKIDLAQDLVCAREMGVNETWTCADCSGQGIKNVTHSHFFSWDLAGQQKNSYHDNIRVWPGNEDDVPQKPTIPTITNVNCTSCNKPDGDNETPYTTSDTTPTFSFDTDVNAYCAISDENNNYTTMGSTRNCTSGEGTQSHICFLAPQDELIYSTDYVYISCADTNFNQTWNASISLQMNITDLEANTSNAIELGIQGSTIWPDATIYSDQQVYLRNLSNSQLLTRVDKVAVYGDQRWLLHYVNEGETFLGLFNMTPSIYVLEMTNISMTDIENKVIAFINATKI